MLYHWKSGTTNLFTEAADVDEARGYITESLEAWRRQEPVLYDIMLADVQRPPHFVAARGHVIVTISPEAEG